MEAPRILTMCIVMTSIILPTAAAGTTVTELDARDQHVRFFYDEDRRVQSEWFTVAPETTRELASVPMGSRFELREFPVAPGVRMTVSLERVDIYAPDARVVVVSNDGEHEIPRSTKARFLGHAVEDPSVRLGLWVAADGSSLRGVSSTPSGFHQVEKVAGEEATYEIGVGAAIRSGLELAVGCDTDDPHLDTKREDRAELPSQTPDLPVDWKRKAATHSAVLAFDTDGELIDNMYAGSTVDAGEGIADWLTAANVIFERDPQLRLMQGNTVLRDDPATDPWSATDTSTQLDEFGDYYAANMNDVDRVFAMWLSGKSSASNTGSGRSWVDSYCENQSYGGSYSVGMVIRAVPLDHVANVRLMVHELGHTAGSPHTHCYTPNIDECHNGQCGSPGCYCGVTVSCPDHSAVLPIPSGQGTLMSYCHFTDANSANCGSNASYFHPTVITRIQGRIAANVGPDCVQSIDPSYPIVTVTKSGTGTGLVKSSPGGIYCGGTCDSPFLPGIPVMMTAYPDFGSAFAGWGGSCGGTGTCAFVTPVFGTKAVTATFVDVLIFNDGFETGNTSRWSAASP